MKKGARVLRRTSQWIGLECREKIHEKIPRKVRYLLWNRAQIEEGGNGGAVQQRRQGRDLQLRRRESRMKGKAVRIGSIRQEESLWQSTGTWERLCVLTDPSFRHEQ